MRNHKQDGKAVNGPDWQDVGIYLKYLEETYGATTQVILCADAGLYSGHVRIDMRLSRPVLVGAGATARHTMSRIWPHHQHKTLEGLIYRMLHEIEQEALQEQYVQRAFDPGV